MRPSTRTWSGSPADSSEARAEGGDLDGLPADAHVREPEPASDEPAAPEEIAHGVRRRGGGDVEILRPEAQQQIAHAAADQVGAVAGVGQDLEYLESAPLMSVSEIPCSDGGMTMG